MHRNERKAQLLESAYANNGAKPVAFIDESYQSRDQRPKDPPFYVATAIVIPPETHEGMRQDLSSIAGSDFWHSTQAFQSAEGQGDLQEMVAYIIEGSEPVIIAVQTEISEQDHDMESSRRTCLTALACGLASGAHCAPVELMVIEERHDNVSRKRDEYTFTQARKNGLLPRHVRLFQASPSYEKLLWLPDIISYAKYRHMAVSDERFFRPIAPMVQTIEVQPPD